jgi:hypothetical protein
VSRKSSGPVAKPRRPATAPNQPSKSEQLRTLAEGSFKWTRLNNWIALAGVVVAVAAIAVPIVVAAITRDVTSLGLAVNVVPRDVIGGAAIYPAPGVRPNEYLGNGESLYIDCLQPVKPSYPLAPSLLAPISTTGLTCST